MYESVLHLLKRNKNLLRKNAPEAETKKRFVANKYIFFQN
jgi:hypothetical protein